MLKRIGVLGVFAVALMAQKVNLQRNVTGTLPVANGGTASTTATAARSALGVPSMRVGTSTPATCTQGVDFFFDTDAEAGQNLYGCTATNTWTLMSGSSPTAVTQADEFTAAGQFAKAAAGSGRATEPSTCYEDANGLHCGDGSAAGQFDVKNQSGAALLEPGSGYSGYGASSTGSPLFRTNGQPTLSIATAASAIGDGAMVVGDGGANGIKASTLTGVLKASSGVPSVVTGTASDCVKVDGSSGACGGSADIFSRTVAEGIDEFLSVGVGNQGLYGVGSWNWLASGCIIGSQYTDSSLNRPGQVGLLRDTSGTCLMYLPLGEYNSTFPRLGNSANWEIRLAFNARAISDDSHKTYIAGLMYDASNNYGFYMRRQGGTDSNWQFVASKSGTTATGDTGISLGTGFLTLRIRSTAAGTIRMSVAQSTGDFGTEQTVCASGCDITFSPVDYQGYAPVFMITTDGAYNTGIGVDYVAYRVEVSR